MILHSTHPWESIFKFHVSETATHTQAHVRAHGCKHTPHLQRNIRTLTPTRTHSLTQSHTHKLTHTHTHALTHSRTHARTHARTHSRPTSHPTCRFNYFLSGLSSNHLIFKIRVYIWRPLQVKTTLTNVGRPGEEMWAPCCDKLATCLYVLLQLRVVGKTR